MFDAVYAASYDSFFEHQNFENECDIITSLWTKSRYNVKNVLDIGCGTGNHAIPLAKRGYNVTGIDQSSDMLNIAQSKAGRLDIDFKQCDMDNLDSLSEKFDAIIMMGAVLGYNVTNEKIRRVLEVCHGLLVPCGTLICDVWHGASLLRDGVGSRTKLEDGCLRIANGRLDIFNQTCNIVYDICNLRQLLSANTGYGVMHGKYDAVREQHIMRYFFPQEITWFFQSVGLSVYGVYGFPDITRPPSFDSRDMLIVGQRTLGGASQH